MASPGRLILLLLLSTYVQFGVSFEFKDAGSDGIRFGEYSNGIQQIEMDEDNEENIRIVVITNAVSQPKLTLLDGDRNALGEVVEADGADWVIKASNKLDFELLTAKRFYFEVSDDASTQNINLKIANIDNKNPTLSTATCVMNENETITIENSVCVFTVSDADGFLKDMDFTNIIASGKEEDLLFELKYKTVPEDNVYQSEVYLVLQDGKQLDFEKTTLYIFHVQAKDAAGHPTQPQESVQIIVEVQDISDEPPVWIDFVFTKRISEGNPDEITVSARDGDYGINNDINYKIDPPNEFVSIGETSGVISITPVDRDAGNDQVTFSVTAYEIGANVGDDETLTTSTQSITLIVDDVDNKIPEISIENSADKFINVEINENSNSPIQASIIIDDKDLGDNAMYTVELVKTNEIDYTEAFQIVPSAGYQRQSFSLTVKDSSKLDFEDELWREITFNIKSVGTKNPANQDILPVTIRLLDLNDEPPVFENDGEFEVEVLETLSIGEILTTIRATDKDANDEVTHNILGSSAAKILEINHIEGTLTTIYKFDYEKQQEFLVQIEAVDKGNNRAIAQLTINVQDVNDETPRIFVEGEIRVQENQIAGYVIESDITATDEDLTAELEFSIDWAKSYATKNSVRVADDVFINFHCLEVKTIKDETGTQVTAEFSIIETVEKNTPDFEIFDRLVVFLEVKDLNTEVGADNVSTPISINIGNENDNPPVFTEDTINTARSVAELSAVDTYIGVIKANDPDELEEPQYSIISTDADTPDWIAIDPISGALTVKVDNIDCDDPVRSNLKYTVTATDSAFSKSLDIIIDIIDQNDCKPEQTGEATSIPEDNQLTGSNQNGQVVFEFVATDKDRSDPFKTVECAFAASTSADVLDRFVIKDSKLEISLSNGKTLDHEDAVNTFNFQLECIDNPRQEGAGIQFPVTPAPEYTITLLDVNDNIPTITNTEALIATENLKKDSKIDEKIGAFDKDEGENSQVNFEIINVRRFEDANYKTEVDGDWNTVFALAEIDNVARTASLVVNQDMEGYYGYYTVALKLTDLGDPPLDNDQASINIEVHKYNFKELDFVFPVKDNDVIYLHTEQSLNAILRLWNEDSLKNIQATDNQNGKYDITFTVLPDSEGNPTIFDIVNHGNSQGELHLTSKEYDVHTKYQITIRANVDSSIASPDPDEASYTKDINVTFGFFNSTSNPEFDVHTATVEFQEEQTDLSQEIQQKAQYPDDVEIDGLEVFYLLREGDSNLFNVDINDGTITLKQKLDYETMQSYTIRIQSSKSRNLDITDDSINTKLDVTINVIDVNDEIPTFDSANYFGTIVVGSEKIGNKVIGITATDKDVISQDKLVFSIDKSSWTASDSSIEPVLTRDPFLMDNNQIILNFELTSIMKGFISFEVVVVDQDPTHEGRALVKIYLVTKDNTVNFRFENPVETVSSKEEEIKNILFEEFGYASNLVTPTLDPSEEDTSVERTLAPMYFIDTEINEPILGTVILKKATDLKVFNRLKSNFLAESLILLSFNAVSGDSENLEELLRTWLIGVSVVLGVLCLVLLIAFVLKTRALNQRIQNLSNTKFGSQESGLNRQGVAAPTTNKHALEGSNPVYNNDISSKEMDRVSMASGDSDLIGAEDDPQFDYDSADQQSSRSETIE